MPNDVSIERGAPPRSAAMSVPLSAVGEPVDPGLGRSAPAEHRPQKQRNSGILHQSAAAFWRHSRVVLGG